MRGTLGALAVAFGLAGAMVLDAAPAQAGLFGTTGQTVQAMYYNGVFSGPELEINSATGTTDPALLTTTVTYQQGAASGSIVTVTDTQIIIQNVLSGAPYCVNGVSVGTSCTDQIDGFDFLFTNENILGVSVNAASAATMQPVSFGTHSGLQLISPNEVRVDLTGDLPLQNDQLILDLAFRSVVTPTPEPASLALLGAGLFGLAATRRRRA